MNILKHLPKPEEETVPVQAMVPESLFTKVNRERCKLNLTWSELFKALFQAFLEEVEKKK